MATSKYTKRTKAIRRVATGSAAGGETLRLQLNRDWLVAEHAIKFAVSQANAGTDPTSVDVRDFVSTISVETSDGRRVFLTGAQAYDLGRFTESASAVTSSLGATSTASWTTEIHYENSEALLDLLTALRSNELTTFDLVITFAADSANGFKGQTSPAAAAYTVEVMSQDYEMLAEQQFGQLLGAAKHYQEKQTKTGTTTGAQADIQLVTGNLTRFIMLHTYDTSGAVPVLANTIIGGGQTRININGRDYRVMTGFDIQQDNVVKRGFDQTGVYVIDFGDDENGWLDLRAVNEARLQWEVASGAPAAYRLDVAQDYTRSGAQ